MLGQKDEAVDGLTKGIEFLFKKNGVEYIRGRGRIAGPGKVEVDAEGGKSTLETKNIVIATGSEVTPLPGVTIDEKRVVSSTGALALEDALRRSLLSGARPVPVLLPRSADPDADALARDPALAPAAPGL